MPSPFPGMDPLLEDPEYWHGFHQDLAGEIRAQLNSRLGPRYRAELGVTTTYEAVGVSGNGQSGVGTGRRFVPDVTLRSSQDTPFGEVAAVPEGTRAPVLSEVPDEVERKLLSVEVRETGTHRLVTAIEILSPINKQPGVRAYEEYLHKRQSLLRSWVHLMELDLLRGGLRPPVVRPVPEAPYYVGLSRAECRPTLEVWPIALWEPLPVVPVPLLEPDPDVPLDLQEAVA